MRPRVRSLRRWRDAALLGLTARAKASGERSTTLEGSVHWMTRGMRFPFIWYAEMYMRLTQAQSRQHELDADLMAARIAGGTSMESALVTIDAAGLIYETYLNSEVAVPGRGRVPATARGRVLEIPARDTHAVGARRGGARAGARQVLAEPYDSHPALNVRLAALHEAPHRPAPDPGPTRDRADQRRARARRDVVPVDDGGRWAATDRLG